MESSLEFTSTLRDVVHFLECLRPVELPIGLETVRDSLLTRSKGTLAMLVAESIGRSSSPEPYLNMNAAGAKGLMATLKREEAELQEYVGAEEHREMRKQRASQQDYYETFQTPETPADAAPSSREAADPPKDSNGEIESSLMNIYATFSADQTKSKCQMCGSLYRRDGKKLFVFEQYRACWVGLVGLHLLIYGTERDTRPCTILPIRGYMARAAPNANPRDQRRNESTFEIFRPGSRTFQFVAKSPEDMEEWVRKISALGGEEKGDRKDSVSKSPSSASGIGEGAKRARSEHREASLASCEEERYQDVGAPIADGVAEKSVGSNGEAALEADERFSSGSFQENSSSSLGVPPSAPAAAADRPAEPPPSPPPFPPALPARIPRRLPSLPVGRKSSYVFPDEEEDDIYHKIEDFRDYGNLVGAAASAPATNPAREVQAYVKTENTAGEKKKRKNVDATKRTSNESRGEETYDDTAGVKACERVEKCASYDDVESLLSGAKTAKARAAEKVDEPLKSPQKKSFLDRVRSKRESPRKVEKKAKLKTPPPCAAVAAESSRESGTYYDDVSDLLNVQQEANAREEERDESEYTSPPPPRPIYVKPPAIVEPIDAQQFYDDVAAYRDKARNVSEASKLDQHNATRPHRFPRDPPRKEADRTVPRDSNDRGGRQVTSPADSEHYKTPRVDSRCPKSQRIDEPEDLYDDIAILANFTARQKEIPSRKDADGATRPQASPEKKSWNLFVGGRKLKPADGSVADTVSRLSSGTDDASDEIGEQHGSMRMNTFQKLISKMENSLGKSSARSASSVMPNKTSASNNA